MGAKYDLGTAEGKVKITYDGKGVDDAVKGQDKLATSQTKTQQQLKEVGTKAGIAGLAIAAGFGVAANEAIGFEKQISAIAAVSGASTKQLDQLRQKALQLGADTQFSANEAAQAMEELAKAGIGTTDILNGAADATVALAAAGGVDLPTAATLAANAMNGFGLSAKDLKGVVDDIAGAANASAIDVGELGQSMQQAAAVAHLTGLSYHDTAVAIAEMGNAGIKGSDAGTSLKTFLQNLIPQTNQQVALFDKLGLTTKGLGNKFFDATGKAKPFADIQQVLANALKGMTKEQELATLQTIFGSDAIRAAAVFADQGAAGFNQLSAAISSTKAADVAAARMNNTAGRLEQLKGSLQTAAIAIGELLLPAIDALAKALTAATNWFSNIGGTWQRVILIAIAVVGGILLLVAAVAKVIEIARLFMVVWRLVNLAFAASPIGFIILAIILLVAVIYLLWTRSAAFRNFFIGIWNAIWGFLKAVGAWFAGPFANFFVALWQKIQTVFNAIWGVIKVIIDFVVGYFRFWWSIVSAIIGFFAPAFKAAFDFVIAVAKLWWAVFSAIWTVAFTVIKAILTPFITFVVAEFKLAFEIITTALKIWWASMVAIWSAIYNFIAPIVSSLVTEVLHWWSFLFNTIITWAKVWWAVFSAVWNTIYSVISAVIGFIVARVQDMVTTVTAIFNGLKVIVDKVRGFFNQLKDAASGGIGNLLSFLGGIPGKIIGALGDLASLLYNSGQKIIQGLIDGIGSMADKVKNKVKDVLSAARDLLPFSPAKEGPFSGTGWTTYSGESIMLGLADGLENKASAAALAMLRAMNSVKSEVSDNSVLATPTLALTGRGGDGAQQVPGNTTTTVNNTVNVKTPAPIVDPYAMATYTIQKLNNAVATRSTPVTVTTTTSPNQED